MYVFRHIIEPSFLVDILLFFAVGSIRMFLVILSLMLHSHILHLSFRFLDRSIFQSFSGSFSGWFVCLFGSLCSRLGGICLFLMLQCNLDSLVCCSFALKSCFRLRCSLHRQIIMYVLSSFLW